MVMVETQKREFDKEFGIDCGLLAKSLDFSGEPPVKKEPNDPIRFVYTGNIYAGRWQALAALGRELDKLNEGGKRAELVIYTMTPMTKAMHNALTLGSIRLPGGVPASEVEGIQNGADVLVYTESMKLREKLLVRLSFSTKLVDYMHTGRCMLAIGPSGIASIDHLKENDAAVTVTDMSELPAAVRDIVEDEAYRERYALNAWRCGAEHHERTTVRKRLYNELEKAAGKI